MKRKAISKSTRFRIFARDNFTCKYCGRQSDAVHLQVDHIFPVKEGGTNDDENLITSCVDCNLGKGAKVLNQAAPTESDRLRLAQERNEQYAAFNAAKMAREAREGMRAEVLKYWCEITGQIAVDRRTLNCVTSYAWEFGFGVVAEWIEIAASRGIRGDANMGRYISGIRRSVIREKEEEQHA